MWFPRAWSLEGCRDGVGLDLGSATRREGCDNAQIDRGTAYLGRQWT